MASAYPVHVALPHHYAPPPHHHSQPCYGTSRGNMVVRESDSPSSVYTPRSESLKRTSSQSHLSFLPCAAHRPEVPDHSTLPSRRLGDRGSIYLSPFRSVRKMKRPFPLVLPTSPPLDYGVAGSKDSAYAKSPMKCQQALRPCRSDLNLAATPFDSVGLLPSPSLSEPVPASPTTPSMHFPIKFNPSSQRYRERPDEDPIPPNFSDESSQHQQTRRLRAGDEEITNVHMAHAILLNSNSNGPPVAAPDPVETPEGTEPHMPRVVPAGGQGTATPQQADSKLSTDSSEGQQTRPRGSTLSSEQSTWAPSNLSYCERWLQGVPTEEVVGVKDAKLKESNRRKFQIVQKRTPPPLRIETRRAPDEPLRFVVASRTKPKLVDISRQSSLVSNSAITTQSVVVPQTPEQYRQEISAFSPDTPLDLSDSGYGTHESRQSFDQFNAAYQDDDDDDRSSSDTGSIGSVSMNSTVVCDKPGSPLKLPASPNLLEPFPPVDDPDPPCVSPVSGFKSSEKKLLEKWWDTEWTMDQLDQAVREFPQSMLRLTSPVIMFLRHNNEKELLRPFRKIFPGVAENVLDCICSVLIAHNHVASLADSQPKTIHHHFAGSDPARLEIVPEKARTTLGIQFLNASPQQVRDRILNSRSAELHKDLDGILDKLLFAISGRSDPTLKSAVIVLTDVLETQARR